MSPPPRTLCPPAFIKNKKKKEMGNVKFQKEQPKSVGEVAGIMYLLEILNNAPSTTSHNQASCTTDSQKQCPYAFLWKGRGQKHVPREKIHMRPNKYLTLVETWAVLRTVTGLEYNLSLVVIQGDFLTPYTPQTSDEEPLLPWKQEVLDCIISNDHHATCLCIHVFYIHDVFQCWSKTFAWKKWTKMI